VANENDESAKMLKARQKVKFLALHLALEEKTR
jgi:hypothetical protein